MTFFKILAFLALAVAMVSALGYIDRFNDIKRQTCLIPDSGTDTYLNPAFCVINGSATGATIIGGEREIYIQRYDGVSGGSGEIKEQSGPIVSNPASPYGFSFNLDSAVAANITFTWDGPSVGKTAPNINLSGLGGYDLTAGGLQDSLQLRLVVSDLAGNLTFTFFQQGGPATLNKTAYVPIYALENVLYVFPFSGMIGPGSLTNLGAITLFIDSLNSSIDLQGQEISLNSVVNSSKAVTWVDTNNDGFVNPGEVVTYTIVIANPDDGSDYNATNVILTDQLPSTITYNAGSAVYSQGSAPTVNGTGYLVWNVGEVDDGFSSQISFTATMGNSLGCGTFTVANQGYVTSSAGGRVPTDNPTTVVALDTTTFPYKSSDSYAINCNTSANVYQAGTQAIFLITYCNVGSAASSSVKVNMTVPANAVFSLTGSSSGWTCANGATSGTICSNTVSNVAVGCHQLNFAVNVNTGLPCTGASMTCVASATAPCISVSTNTYVVPVQAQSNMAITKTANIQTETPGTTIIYTLSYSNAGPANAANSVITETVPQYTTFNNAQSTAGWACGGTTAGSTCTFTIASTLAGAPAASVAFAVTMVSPAPCPATSIFNNATIHDTCDNTDSSSAVTIPINANVNLAITKTDNVPGARPGQYILYNICFQNSGNRDSPNGLIYDIIPSYTSYTATGSTAGWSCAEGAAAGTNCTMSVGTIAAGAAQRCVNLAVYVTGKPPAGINIVNTAGAMGGCGSAVSVVENVPTLGNPDVYVRKTHAAGTYGASNSEIIFVITVGNNGTIFATGVTVTDTMPTGATFNSQGSTAGWTCVGQVCTFVIPGQLGIGLFQTLNFAMNVPTPINCNPPAVVNNVRVTDDSAQGTDNNTANNAAQDTVPITAVPSLTVSESANVSSVAPCGYVSYTVTYANTGSGCDTGANLMMMVPEYTTYEATGSANWNCQNGGVAGSMCSLSLGRFCPGSAANAVFNVHVDCDLDCSATHFIAMANITGTCSNMASTSVITVTLTGQPELAVTKKVDNVADGASAVPGQVLVYTITAMNNGNRGETGSTLTETIPDYTTFNAAQSDDGWDCDMTAGTCTLDSGAMDVGATASYAFAVNVNRPFPSNEVVDNVVTLVGECDSVPSRAEVIVKVAGPPDLTLCKRAECASVFFTLDYSNVAPFDASGVTITEMLPEGGELDVVNSTPQGMWDCNNETRECTLDIGDLDGQTAGTAIFAVKPLTQHFGCFNNTASIADDGANGPEPTYANNVGHAMMGSECDEPCPDCPTPTPAPECPTMTPAPSCAPCETCPDCPEPCCPEPVCEPCQGDIENQVNFVFAGLIPAPQESQLPTCCSSNTRK